MTILNRMYTKGLTRGTREYFETPLMFAKLHWDLLEKEYPLMINIILTHSSFIVRKELASNPTIPEHIIEVLAKDSSEGVIYALLRTHQSKIPYNILLKLSEQPNDIIRGFVAEYGVIDDNLIMKLSKDNSSFVRFSLARKPNLDKKILENLTKDTDEDVRKTAFEKLELLERGLKW